LGGLGGVDRSVVDVVGLEVGAAMERTALFGQDRPLTIEVGRGGDQDIALDDIATDRRAGRLVQAKFRTGPTPAWPWPDETELAAFLRAAVNRGLPFKLTGGLHHAVRGDHPSVAGAVAQPQHGLLNVLLAVHRALGGDDTVGLSSILAEPDPKALVAAVRALTEAEVADVRSAFTAYGCCGVTDPITELADLGLL
ncbi:MAG: hypothetical protein ABI131_08095, partial [Nostocoides sp.]